MKIGIHFAGARFPGTEAWKVVNTLNYGSIRTPGYVAAIKPEGPGDAPDYGRIDNAVRQIARSGKRCWVILGFHGPWKWGARPGVSLKNWGWRVAYPGGSEDPAMAPDAWGHNIGYGNRGTRGTVGATRGSDWDCEYDDSGWIYSNKQIDQYANPGLRIPRSAWVPWLTVVQLAINRWTQRWVDAGRKLSDLGFEVGNEGWHDAANWMPDRHHIAFTNEAMKFLKFPAGLMGLGHDSFGGLLVKRSFEEELNAWKKSLDTSIQLGFDYSPYTHFNIHSYYHHVTLPKDKKEPKIDFDAFVEEMYQRVAQFAEYGLSKAQLKGKKVLLSEYGVSLRQLDTKSEVVRAEVARKIEERFKRGPWEEMVWFCADSTDTWGLVKADGTPIYTVAEFRAARGLGTGGSLEPATGRFYDRGAN